MKYIIFITLLIFASLSYNPDAAVQYARLYCQSYNPKYPRYVDDFSDSAHFISQCLIAGGIDLKECHARTNGVIFGVTSLKNCLIKKGWHISTKKPQNFRSGYIMTNLKDIIIATSVERDIIKYCGHTPNVCYKKLTFEVLYLYP